MSYNYYSYTVRRIKNILFELVPFMKEIKNTMNFLEANLTNFNESIHQLTTQLEEHKNQTAIELAQLQTFLVDNLTHQLNGINGCIDHERLPEYTCEGTGGWQRVVYLNMTDPTSTCPSGWNITGYSKRTCGRASSGSNTCDSVTFPVNKSYAKLCGRIKAYQWGIPDAFGYVTNIDGSYVEGVSLTHGSPRQHIWTFVVGVSENSPGSRDVCPCDATI